MGQCHSPSLRKQFLLHTKPRRVQGSLNASFRAIQLRSFKLPKQTQVTEHEPSMRCLLNRPRLVHTTQLLTKNLCHREPHGWGRGRSDGGRRMRKPEETLAARARLPLFLGEEKPRLASISLTLPRLLSHPGQLSPGIYTIQNKAGNSAEKQE